MSDEPEMRVSGGAYIPSESDERVRNDYRILDDGEKEKMRAVKAKGKELIEVILGLGFTRETEIALVNAEQAVMWAVKHITR